VASPVFKTAWAAVRSPEGSTPFLLRQVSGCGGGHATRESFAREACDSGTARFPAVPRVQLRRLPWLGFAYPGRLWQNRSQLGDADLGRHLLTMMPSWFSAHYDLAYTKFKCGKPL